MLVSFHRRTVNGAAPYAAAFNNWACYQIVTALGQLQCKLRTSMAPHTHHREQWPPQLLVGVWHICCSDQNIHRVDRRPC